MKCKRTVATNMKIIKHEIKNNITFNTINRIDIAKAPNVKKEYRIRMAPTIILFKGGVKEEMWKAGLDLLLPTNLKEIQEAIDEANTASRF